MEDVLDYLKANYSQGDAERLASTKIVADLAFRNPKPISWKQHIDKVAIFNNIKKKTEQPKQGFPQTLRVGETEVVFEREGIKIKKNGLSISLTPEEMMLLAQKSRELGNNQGGIF